MGKPSAPTIGYHYRPAMHLGISPRRMNGILEVRGGDTQVAWQGSVTESGIIHIDAPKLFGGEKDQGGMVGDLAVMFGDDDQMPNDYLVSVFGNQTATWRGVTTIAWQGGRYGAMNPYPRPLNTKWWRTTEGWDDACWYPEKASIPLGSELGAPSVWLDGFSVSLIGADIAVTDPISGDNQFTQEMADQYGLHYDPVEPGDNWLYFWRPNESGLYYSKREEGTQFNVDMVPILLSRGWQHDTVAIIRFWNVGAGLHACVYTLGATSSAPPAPSGYGWIEADQSPMSTSVGMIRLWESTDFVEASSAFFAANPAHVLYESLTAADMGREPEENINDASFRSAADRLYAEELGICPKWDASQESVEDFQKRIGKLIGGSVNRSLGDGQWYLDLARGDYVLDDLPIVNDDDILSFKEAPTTLDDAINSVSVKYRDPEKKTDPITPPVRSLALVQAFGTIHQTYEYLEIPTADLAARVATRDMLASTTPTRAFDLVCKPTIYKLRPNQYFRLQSPKRGIADMVCLVGEKEGGTLKSGAIKLKAVQDIYGMPTTSFVQAEPGVDTRPPQTPSAITLQAAFEAPYIKVCGAMPRSDLDALPTDVGFAMAVAASPASELDFTMMVDAGGGYEEAGNGEWAATATVNEAAGKTDTDFTLAAGKRLDQVLVGMGALWENEECRVDAIDASAGTITLGRGCADTVPAEHAADSRLWFYDVGMAYGTTEFIDGETVDVKLLSNTGSQQLPIGSATPLSLTFDQRQSRPYPPGNVKIDGVAWPAAESGTFTVTWAHRDRVQQADQLIDTTAASIGPEATTRYALRLYNDSTNALLVEKLDIDGATATVNLAASATVRMELWSTSDRGDSWQKHVHVFAYTSTGGGNAVTAATYAPPTWVIDGNGA